MKSRQMVSILVPSRGRPDNLRRLYNSLLQTTGGEWELLVRLDDDDPTRGEYDQPPHQANVTAPRGLMSQLWNDLIPYALGDIFMLGGDDITFNTPGWDGLIRDAFPEDGIALVHGNDLSPNSATIATHPFVSRLWVETLGYLAPPYFASDYNDLWLTEVANDLGRHFYIPEVVTEHHHPAFGKAEFDATHLERIERHKAEAVDAVWRDTADKRQEDVDKLLPLLK